MKINFHSAADADLYNLQTINSLYACIILTCSELVVITVANLLCIVVQVISILRNTVLIHNVTLCVENYKDISKKLAHRTIVPLGNVCMVLMSIYFKTNEFMVQHNHIL